MTGLRVIDCGIGTTVQDRGRFGLRRYGVSTSGTMDIESAGLANALTGNPPEMACVEFQMAGGRFAVEGGHAIVALSGPGCMLRIGGNTVPDGCSARSGPGDVIEVGPVRGGVFAYLAVGGGFDLPEMMGSLSVHRRSGIGGPGACTRRPAAFQGSGARKTVEKRTRCRSHRSGPPCPRAPARSFRRRSTGAALRQSICRQAGQ